MIATAIYLMFLTWLSIEHGTETVGLGDVFKILGAGILALWYDMKQSGK